MPVAGPAEDGEDARRARSPATSSTGSVTGCRPVVGVGPVAADVAGLAHARAGVDRALRVLREGRGERRVGRLDDSRSRR